MTMYPTGSTNPMEQALTLNPADQAYVYGPSDAAARTRFTSGVAHDPTVRTITDPVEQELALMERRRANPRQGPIPTPLSQAKTIPANWAGETVPMDAFLAQQGSVQSGTRDAHYMPDGTIRNSAGEIIDVPADVVPTKANVEEIAAKSETPADVERRLAAEKAQTLSARKGTGLVKSLGPVLGTGLAVALAPDEAWALDKPALDYWGSAATGLDFGKFREDYSAALSDDAKQQWQDSMDFYGGLAKNVTDFVSEVTTPTSVATQPAGFSTATGAGGFTGGSQMFDMGMDPTFANTGGWGPPEYTASLPAIAGTAIGAIPAGKVVTSLPSTVS